MGLHVHVRFLEFDYNGPSELPSNADKFKSDI